MSSAVLLNGIGWQIRSPGRAVTAPPRRRRPPVFIHDAVTPWQGETMLLTLLRAQALADIADEDDQP